MSKNTYNKRKEAGLCVFCGKEKDNDTLMCFVCKNKNSEKQKNKYDKYKQENKCTLCGEDKENSERTLCLKCTEKTKIRDNKIYYKLKESNLCVYCKKNKPEEGKCACRFCLDKQIVNKAILDTIREENGVCVRCVKNEVEIDSRYCSDCIKKSKERHKKELQKLKSQVFIAYGNACICCGETEKSMLQVDHVLNNGAEKRREGGEGTVSLYRKLIKAGFPKVEYQLLCCNCNWSKRIYGKCIHQIKKLEKSSLDYNISSSMFLSDFMG